MELNVTSYKRTKQIVNQNLPIKYFEPKSDKDQQALTIDTRIMSTNQIEEHYKKYVFTKC